MNETLGSTFQTISSICLSGLLLLEWIALRTLVQETLVLKHLYEPSEAAATPEDAILGLRPRPFRAVHLDSSAVFTDLDLIGQLTTFLFVLPKEVLSQGNSVFTSILHSLWQRRRGPLYIVCSGPIETCQLLCNTYRLGTTHNSQIGVLLDEGESLRRNFSVASALSAVVIDENGRVAKVGGMESEAFTQSAPGDVS